MGWEGTRGDTLGKDVVILSDVRRWFVEVDDRERVISLLDALLHSRRRMGLSGKVREGKTGMGLRKWFGSSGFPMGDLVF